jgi:hypothetical protein
MQSSKAASFIKKPMISRTNHEYSVRETVSFPQEIRHADNIGWGEKCFLAEIMSLCDKEGYIPYSAKGLSELFKVSLPTIASWVKHLTEVGLIELGVKQSGNKWYNSIKLAKQS